MVTVSMCVIELCFWSVFCDVIFYELVDSCSVCALPQASDALQRLYINFNRAEDVIEFAEFFNGHVFVNEKGVGKEDITFV
ncbi:hypothetical protein QQ045_023804 [Rhodiola kirilowii]